MDAADGYAARALGQSTKFGAMLDMVIDRSATAGLLAFLSAISLANNHAFLSFVFQLAIGLDVSSHYMVMAAAKTDESHKSKMASSNLFRLLSFYYASKVNEMKAIE